MVRTHETYNARRGSMGAGRINPATIDTTTMRHNNDSRRRNSVEHLQHNTDKNLTDFFEQSGEMSRRLNIIDKQYNLRYMSDLLSFVENKNTSALQTFLVENGFNTGEAETITHAVMLDDGVKKHSSRRWEVIKTFKWSDERIANIMENFPSAIIKLIHSICKDTSAEDLEKLIDSPMFLHHFKTNNEKVIYKIMKRRLETLLDHSNLRTPQTHTHQTNPPITQTHESNVTPLSSRTITTPEELASMGIREQLKFIMQAPLDDDVIKLTKARAQLTYGNTEAHQKPN